MAPTKACPVVLRTRDSVTQILAFKHPLADCQLVKGTIAEAETPQAAAVRELWEEAGLVAQAGEALGLWDAEYEHQIWSFHICHLDETPAETWVHQCSDDGGHAFAFFWQPIDAPLVDWHPVHARAFAFIHEAVKARPAAT